MDSYISSPLKEKGHYSLPLNTIVIVLSVIYLFHKFTWRLATDAVTRNVTQE